MVMRKKSTSFISMMLVCVMLFGMIATPIQAKAADDTEGKTEPVVETSENDVLDNGEDKILAPTSLEDEADNVVPLNNENNDPVTEDPGVKEQYEQENNDSEEPEIDPTPAPTPAPTVTPAPTTPPTQVPEKEMFEEPVAGTTLSNKDMENINFNETARLIVVEPDKIVDPEHVMSEYKGVYLLQYASASQARNAYAYYYDHAVLVNVDSVMRVADGDELPEAPDGMTEEENPLTELSEEKVKSLSGNVIALIDTGASEHDNVVKRVSMFGDDVDDDNGHGDRMVGYIVAQNPDAKILSIKAFDKSGKATVSSVYAAFEYAINAGAKIINLSASALQNEENSIVMDMIDQATKAGIIVVGSAGNNGIDAKYFIPGANENAIIVGACSEDGKTIRNSNRGKSVDFDVVAATTSEAAAKMSGYISAHLKNGKVDYSDGLYELFFDGTTPPADTDEPEKPVTTPKPDEDDGEFEVSGTSIVAIGTLKSGEAWNVLYYAFGNAVNIVYGTDAANYVKNEITSLVNSGAIGPTLLVGMDSAAYSNASGALKSYESSYSAVANSNYASKIVYNADCACNNSKVAIAGYSAGPRIAEAVGAAIYTGSYTGGKAAPKYFGVMSGSFGSYSTTTTDNFYNLFKTDKSRHLYLYCGANTYTDPGLYDMSAYFSGSDYGNLQSRWASMSNVHYTRYSSGTYNGSSIAYHGLAMAQFATKAFAQNALVDENCTGTLNITKNDAKTGGGLAGAEITIYTNAAATTAVKTVTTDGNGRASAVLNAGTYYVKETKAPNGYKLNSTVFTVNVPECGNGSVSIPDEPNEGYLKLQKTSANPGITNGNNHYSLANAVYYVYSNSACTNKVGELKTDAAGNSNTITVAAGTYYVKEATAPQGFALDGTVYTVEVTSGSTATVNCTDQPMLGGVNLKKVSANPALTNGNNCYTLEGAVYGVYSDGGCSNKLGELPTNADGNTNTISVGAGNYYVKEITAPRGYALDTRVYTANVTPNGTYTVKCSDQPLNDPVIIRIEKVDAEGKTVPGATLEGAQYTVKYYDGYYNKSNLPANATRTWVIETKKLGNFYVAILDDEHLVSGDAFYLSNSGNITLPLGTIAIQETKAPDGYKISGASTFDGLYVAQIANDNGIASLVGSYEFTQQEYVTQISISKVNEAGNRVAGAAMKLTDASGTTVAEWTSETEPKIIEGLIVGDTYTLSETTPPAGYTTAAPVTFTVKDQADVQYVTMTDKAKVVEIIKVDTDGAALEGATLQITLKGDDDVIDSWVTDKTAHQINGLTVGATYVLTETKAAKDYSIAAPIEFTVEDNDAVQTVTMTDKKFTVYKIDADGNYLAGIKLGIYDADDKLVDSWVSRSDRGYIVTGLKVGQTYTLVEMETPTGYVTAKPMEFTVNDNNRDQSLYMTDQRVLVEKKNVDDEYVVGAKLQVVDSEGNVVDSWTSTIAPHYVSGLTAGESYTLVENAAPTGYVQAKPVEFTVNTDNKNQTVEMLDKQLFVNKVDNDGEPVAGAVLQILDKDGEVVDTWTTKTSPYAASGLIAGETYTLTEVSTPAGYATAEDLEFTVEDNTVDQNVYMTDMYTKITVIKPDANGIGLSGAKLRVEDGDGNVIHSWISDGKPVTLTHLRVGATYYVVEETAPETYVQFESRKIVIADTGDEQIIAVANKQLSVSKQDIAGAELPGAELTISDLDGNVIENWISGDEPHYVSGLKEGETYILTENLAPLGYAIAESVEFTVESDGKDQQVEMVDKLVCVSKQDIAGAELPGAELTVSDLDGNVIESWISGEEPHKVSGLKVGETYSLTETLAPLGYATAESIEFTVEADGQNQQIDMVNKLSQFDISKQDIAGEEVPGAKLQIVDKNGDVVDEWISEDTPHRIEGLHIGETYTLVEDLAPMGYAVAESIEFTVEDTEELQTATMINKTVSISKQDIAGEELPGALLQITDENGQVVASWTSTDTPHVVTGLFEGKTYTLTETAAPNGYATSESVEFTVTGANENGVKVNDTFVMVDAPIVTSFEKLNTKDETVVGVHLQLFDEENKLVEEWDTEVAPHIIDNLHVGKTYRLHEESAPLGYKLAEDIKFILEDTEEVQTITMVNEFDEGVGQIYKMDAIFESPVAGAVIRIIDKTNNTVQEVTSDNNGYIFFKIMAGHSYEYKEIQAPTGYRLNSDVHYVRVDGKMVLSGETTLKNSPVGTVVLIKYDSTNGNAVAGATLDVYNAAGEKVFTGVTDSYGRVYVALANGEPLPAGTYTFKESKAPNGYKLNTSSMTFYVDADGNVTGNTKMPNTKTPTGDKGIPTGDNSNIFRNAIFLGIFAMLTICSGAFLIVDGKKKRRETEVPAENGTDTQQ